MSDVNWWLMLLSFALGGIISWFWMVRRVTREVPRTVTKSVAKPAGLAGAGAKVETPKVETPKVETPKVGAASAAVATGTGLGVAKFAESRFGAGSADPAADGSGPDGWTIKGNADSMLYHTTDSPTYRATIAEVWFQDESSAQSAGFTRWDARRKKKAADAEAAAAAAAAPVTFTEASFGKGSAVPNDDGSGPDGWDIKGNEDSMLFHTIDSPWYKRTKAEVWFQDEDTARAAGFTRWDERDKTAGAATTAAPAAFTEASFGKGSAVPNDDGTGPDGWDIKGNEDSMLFHTIDSPWYKRTKAEVWFQDEDTARAAGFTRWDERNR